MKKFKKMLSLILSVTILLTVLSGMSLSAEETTTEEDDEITVWSPLKNVYSTSVNPIEENPEFTWGVYSNRSGKYGIFACTNFSAGKLTVPDDSMLISYDKYAANGLYSFTNNRTNKITFSLRKNSDFYFAFTAPSDGYYVMQGTNFAGKADEETMYVRQVDSESGTKTLLTGIDFNSTGSVSAELKAGDQLTITAHISSGTDTAFGFTKLYVSKLDYTLDTEAETKTTHYDFTASDRKAVFGSLSDKTDHWDFTLSDSIWNYESFRLTTDLEYDTVVPTCPINYTYANKQTLTLDDGTTATVYNPKCIQARNTSYVQNGASCGSAIVYDTGTEPLGGLDYRDVGGTYYYYGLRFKFTVPEDGTAKMTGAYSTYTAVAKSRFGIIRADGDGTVEYINTWTAGSITKGDASTATTRSFGEVEAGDIIVYEVFKRNESKGRLLVNLNSLSVALTTNTSEVITVTNGYRTNTSNVFTPIEMMTTAGSSDYMSASAKDLIWKFKANNRYMNYVTGNNTSFTLTEYPVGFSEYITVASYNVKSLYDSKTKIYGNGLDDIAEEISAIDPDIIGLQEIDNGMSRSGNEDQTKLLAEALGYEYYYFGKATNKGGGEYGHCLLSKFPIISSETVVFDTQLGAGYETRSYESYVIDINGTNVNVYNTHLANLGKLQEEQFAEIYAVAEQQEYAIIMGDFNKAPSYFSSIINLDKMIALNGGETYAKPKYTCGAGENSTSPIDNIVVSRNIKHYWEEENDSGIIVNKTTNSDHNMIYTYLNFGEEIEDEKTLSSYTVNHGTTEVTLGADGVKGDSGTKRSVLFTFANADDKMQLGFTVPDDENGIYEISAPISVIGDGKITYSVIKETKDGVRSYLQTEKVYEKSDSSLDDYLCELLVELEEGDTVWFEATSDTAGASINLGVPKATRYTDYSELNGTSTLDFSAIDNLEYVAYAYDDDINDNGFAYANETNSLINFASAWRSGYFADYVTSADADPFGISALTSGDDATEFTKKFSTFDLSAASGNYFQTSFAAAFSKGENAGSLYVEEDNYFDNLINMCVGYEETNGNYNAGIFHEFTAPVDGTAALKYATNSNISVLTLIKDGKNGKYTISTVDTVELKKGDSIVICYYKLGGKASVTLEAPVVTMTSSLGQVSFDKSTDKVENTVTSNLLNNGTEITLPSACQLEDCYFLDSWTDNNGNEYEINSIFTVNGNTLFTANTGIYGDTDRSGNLDALDITSMRKYLIGAQTEIYRKAADMNTDSNINLKDLVALKKKLASIG